MAASREFEAAYEAIDNSHSVFTQALLAGLNPHKVKGGVVNNHHLCEAVNRQLQGEIQQPLFESSGSAIVLTRTSGQQAAVQTSTKSLLERLQQLKYAFCPFQGLQPFEEVHANFFFGRETFTQELVQYVKRSRLCTLIGPSGSGKTSVLQAGLMHHLRHSAVSRDSSWDIRYLRPTQQPLQKLAEAFISDHTTGVERAEQIARAESLLTSTHSGCSALVRSMLPDASVNMAVPPAQQMLLIVDQLEDLWQPTISDAERAQFCRCLEDLVSNSHRPVHVVLGLRGEGLKRLQAYPQLCALAMEHCLWLPPMSYEQVKATIVKPLEKLGLGYDPNLIYTLLLDVVGAPGELPMLQLALLELWRRRRRHPNSSEPPQLTLSAYADMGGIRKLLSDLATKTLGELSTAEQAVARRIFLSLTELGNGTEDSRRRASLNELITPALSPTLVESTLQKLAAARMIILNQQPHCHTDPQEGMAVPELAWNSQKLTEEGRPQLSLLPCSQRHANEGDALTIDIVHESLIRAWPQLQIWLSSCRSTLQQQRGLETAAHEWASQHQPAHPDYLLRGQRLRAALTFQTQHEEWLSSLAQEYIAHSQQMERRRQLQRWMLRSLIPVSLAAGMLAAYSYYNLKRQLAKQTVPAGAYEELTTSDPIIPLMAQPPTAGAEVSGPFSSLAALLPLTYNSAMSVLAPARHIASEQIMASSGGLTSLINKVGVF